MYLVPKKDGQVVEGGNLKKDNARSCFHSLTDTGGFLEAAGGVLTARSRCVWSRKEERTGSPSKTATETPHCRGPVLGSSG